MRNILLSTFFLGIHSMLMALNPKNISEVDRIIATFNHAQTNAELADFINNQFSSSEEKARALHYWIANNISYDASNVYMVEAQSDVFNTRKGVSADFVTLFQDISNEIDLTVHRVDGYRKINGKIDLTPHSWLVVQLDDAKWYMFDPMWSSGSLQDGKFIKKYNEDYYRKSPQEFIGTHIPHDPLWQILDAPVTKSEFKKADISANRRDENFKVKLNSFLTSNTEERLKNEIERIESNGVDNIVTFYYLKDKKRELEDYLYQVRITSLNEIKHLYESTVYQLNNIIHLRNSFYSQLNNDKELRLEKHKLASLLSHARQNIGDYEEKYDVDCEKIKYIKNSLNQLEPSINDQLQFVSRYLTTTPEDRYELFTN